MLTEYKKISATKVDPDVLLKAKLKLPFYNTSRWTFASLITLASNVWTKCFAH